jgi:SOS-response transcriptional repressor LexA
MPFAYSTVNPADTAAEQNDRMKVAKSPIALLTDLVERHGRAQLLERTGISKQYLSNLLNGAKPLGPKIRDTIEQRLDLPPGWFASGGDAAGGARSRVVYLPVMKWDHLGARPHPNTTTSVMPYAEPLSSAAFVLPVETDAMVAPTAHERSLTPGSYIVVEPEAPARVGDFVVALLDGARAGIVRQLIEDGGFKYLGALNPRYVELVKVNDRVKIIGRVMACIAKF